MTEVKELFADLNKSFEAFKTANDENLKQRDAVADEKVEKINAHLSDLENQIKDAQTKIEAAKLGGVGSSKDLKDAEYTAEFENYMRKGFEGSKIIDFRAQVSKGTDSEGGYFAPTEWDRTIGQKLKLQDTLRKVAKVQATSKNAFTKLFSDNAAASGWVAETGARAATANSVISSLAFATNEIYANVAVTQTILDDAEINIEQWLSDEVEQQFAAAEGAAFVSGNGTNQPFGLLTYATGAANATKHPYGAIGVVNSGVAATIGATPDKIIDMIQALPSKYAANASFIMNRGVVGSARKIKDSTGQYMWQPSNIAGQPSTLLGYAVDEISDMPNEAANAFPIGFGDWQQAYLIVDRVEVRVLRDPYSNKPFVMFYVTKRVGGGVQNSEAAKLLKCST